ncbi:MAG TPA: hypothetical protein VK274_09550 [Pyrinomonadaceae bacterium]|nr:hypothetical protein [Pyrinomonadaceae bacterium]
MVPFIGLATDYTDLHRSKVSLDEAVVLAEEQAEHFIALDEGDH